jgi:hypothetical protein
MIMSLGSHIRAVVGAAHLGGAEWLSVNPIKTEGVSLCSGTT